MAKMNSIRVLFLMATTYSLELRQADVDTAFLYGDMLTIWLLPAAHLKK